MKCKTKRYEVNEFEPLLISNFRPNAFFRILETILTILKKSSIHFEKMANVNRNLKALGRKYEKSGLNSLTLQFDFIWNNYLKEIKVLILFYVLIYSYIHFIHKVSFLLLVPTNMTIIYSCV